MGRSPSSTRVAGWDHTFPASPAGAIPPTVFADTHTVPMNGASLELKHYAPAHADCDIAVHFPDADIIHVGDTWCNGFYPFIDYSTGGSINGMIRATEVNLARVANKTIIIPGHGPVADKAQLTDFRDMLVSVCDKVAALKKQGRSVAEVVATKPTAATDARWGGFLTPPRPFC